MDDKFDYFMERLLQYAFDHKIGYILTKKLDPYTPSLALPEDNRMIINLNWHNHNEIPFSLAHEIGHVVNGDVGKLYYAPGSFDKRFERQANLTALKLILPLYIDANDGLVPNNYQTVMDQLQIPQLLENDVKEQFSKLIIY
ncbi:ImmA/IrrE family metallo-endopeptidase [Lactiplantibacillus brownii]|uniref:ImmA/IrrE family metallo-endopeptidase n=1 Tax=Lactiplantibacillus brownii TaxID=3069269 RepID=UPI0038B355EF